MKKEILMAIMVLGLLSCKKKKENQVVEQTTSAPDPCFNSQYNGTYHGYGNTSTGTFTSGTLILSKTGCESCSIYLTTNSGGSFSDNINQLVLNSSNGFSGKQTNGNDITIVLGSHLDVRAVGSYTFTGQK